MKFSIVTPTFNSEKYIAETIESVISQEGNFEIEYIIVDKCSTDNTVSLIKQYEKRVDENKSLIKCNQVTFIWISEQDRGMYDAINKGFEMAKGDVYAWINASDIYCSGAFSAVQKTFDKYPQIFWLRGITSFIDEKSRPVQMGQCILYDQAWIQKGVYGRESYFIGQESVFWRARLWKSIKRIDSNLKLAGDFYLWKCFAQNSKLYTLKSYLSCFRRHDQQLSRNMMAYLQECDQISPAFNWYRKFIRFCLIFESKFFPRFLRPFIFRVLVGKRDFNLVEFSKDEPILKKKAYYIA